MVETLAVGRGPLSGERAVSKPPCTPFLLLLLLALTLMTFPDRADSG